MTSLTGSLSSLYDHPPLLLRFFGSGTILSHIRWRLLGFSCWAALVWILFKYGILCFPAASRLSSAIQLVVGLLVSYRSGSSSDRWHEGRRIWASTTSASRSLLRIIPLALSPLKDNTPDAEAVKEVLALIPAFGYAMKYHLRSETRPWLHSDLADLLPREYILALEAPYKEDAVQEPLPTERSLRQFPGTKSLRQRRSSAHLSFGQGEAKEAAKAERLLNKDEPAELMARGEAPSDVTDNLPLDILRLILAYLNLFHTQAGPTAGSPEEAHPRLETPTWATCMSLINTLTEHLSNVERIRDTPIPMALAIHLEQLMTIYLLLVAPQHVKAAGWMVIPITFLATFTFFGIHAIGQQLSDPFGHGHDNALPIDRFCADLRREWAITVRGRRELNGEVGPKAWSPNPYRLTGKTQ